MIIYILTNKINGKIYIGQTVSTLNVRWSQHVHEALKTDSDRVIAKAIRKYGPDEFNRKILARCNTMEEMNHREKYYIKLFGSLVPVGYNIDDGGKNKRMHEITKQKLSKARMGKKLGPHTEEHKKNLSIAHKGRKYPNRVDSEETKKKRSLATSGSNNPNFGKKWTEEMKKKASEIKKGTGVGADNPFFGKKHTVESRTKISKSRIGKYSGENNPQFGLRGELSPNFDRKATEEAKQNMSRGQDKVKIKILCINNGVIYESMSQAAKALSVSMAGIRKVLKNKTPAVKGLVFKKVEKE
jgi:group I intron endonuclease